MVPDYIFESSWEVCNKVGGIYTVLSTRAKTLQEKFQDRIIFIGPDFWDEKESPYFREEKALLAGWQWEAKEQGLKVRVGRWTIPSEPIAVLVDFKPYFEQKNEIYTWAWENYGVDSLHAYGDYDEASMFSWAAGKVVESLYNFVSEEEIVKSEKFAAAVPFAEGTTEANSSLFTYHSSLKAVYHANEWMCGLGALYIKKVLPQIGTIFTTHATSIGRSIAGNQKPLYDYLFAYNGDQMAGELNMQSKHSIEKQTAHNVDCFTTVSDITANECLELLDKPVDVVLPNGFDNSFVPKPQTFGRKRKLARRRMLDVANALLGEQLQDEDTLIVSTSGRYEFRNKGIDVFIEAMNRLLRDRDLKKTVLAFIVVPGWVGEPRLDLVERLSESEKLKVKGEKRSYQPSADSATRTNHTCNPSLDTYNSPLEVPMITHWLHNMGHDNVLNMLKFYDMHNRHEDRVKVIFLPCYLDGSDGILNLTYYDVVLGNDLCIYPSYYEPWGYTPLEAVAFKVPCITTDLAGFGLWVNKELGHQGEITDGVKVIHRTDYNYSEVADYIKDTVADYSAMTQKEVDASRKNAEALSKKALWSEFIQFYYEAYDIALRKAEQRKSL